MPMYSYTAKDSDGHTKSDIVEALSEQSLVEKLQAQGYFVTGVKPVVAQSGFKAKGGPLVQKFSHTNVKLEDLLVFSRQLATMLEAGVTMLRSLDVIVSQIQSKQLFETVKAIRANIEQGGSLSSGLAKHPKIFNQFWISLAEVGEASGTMPQVLTKIADHIEQEAAFKSLIIAAVIYPIILAFVAVGAIIFFALVVAPRFEEVFKSMHAQLPVMTRALLAVFHFIKRDIVLLLGGTAGLFFLLRFYFGTPTGRLVLEKILFRMPVMGEILKLIIVERFTAQMSILVDSGVPILYSLEICEKLVDNKTCGLIIAEVRASVREGKSMADSLMESGFFPPMAAQMIKVGEESGELAKMLRHVAVFYKNNVEGFMKRFGALIEPFMLIFMAGAIGVIVVAVFMPLFKMGQGFHAH